MATWNVEGIRLDAECSKLHQIVTIMRDRGLKLVAMQETHVCAAPWFLYDGFLVILSGGPEGERERAGVGFVIAPSVKHAVMGFVQHNNRMASARLRVAGGSVSLISAYAPHSGLEYELRQDLYTKLQ